MCVWVSVCVFMCVCTYVHITWLYNLYNVTLAKYKHPISRRVICRYKCVYTPTYFPHTSTYTNTYLHVHIWYALNAYLHIRQEFIYWIRICTYKSSLLKYYMPHVILPLRCVHSRWVFFCIHSASSHTYICTYIRIICTRDTCKYLYMYMHIHVYLHVYIPLDAYVYRYIHVYQYIHICTCISTYICIYMYMYIYIHVDIHVHMYIYWRVPC